jgi:hypothetical protein
MNILSPHIDLLVEEQNEYMVEKVYWIKVLEHYKISNTIGLTHGGSVYGFVFNETQPKENQLTSDFQEVVYIGESIGWYYDKKNGEKKLPRKTSYLNKRIIHHRDRFNGTAKVSSDETEKYQLFEDKYGLGFDVLNGTFTGKPLWVGFLPIPINFPELMHKNWVRTYERLELKRYKKKFNKKTLMNLDEDYNNKNEESASSKYEIPDVTSFMK